jgi:hypothetical protein
MGLMKKKSRVKVKSKQQTSYEWLPIQPWLIPSFEFTHVRGIARVFLIAEIILSSVVVIGSLLLFALKVYYSK